MITRVLVWMILGYQRTFGSIMPPVCRYAPSCSNYALEAVQKHGPVRGSYLAVRRLLRCNPWGGRGCDPVPD